MIVSFIFIKFKRLSIPSPISLPPSTPVFPWTIRYATCSKYLGIFLMFFCYWPLNYFHCGKRTYSLYDLDPFAGICFMAQNTVSLGDVSTWSSAHTLPDAQWVMRCPRCQLGAGRSPPACSSSFISSFPLGWVFPQCLVFSLSPSDSQSDEDSGQRFHGSGSGIPLCCLTAQPSPDSQSPFFSRQGLLSMAPSPRTASSLTEWVGSLYLLHSQSAVTCHLGENHPASQRCTMENTRLF